MVSMTSQEQHSSTALTVQQQQHTSSQQQVEISRPEDLIGLIDTLAFNTAFSYEDQAMLADRLIPGLVEKAQTYVIGLGYTLWRIQDLWYEYYRDILLGSGPRKRDGFHHWCIDQHHLEVPYVNNVISSYEIWNSAQRFRVKVENLIQPLSPNVQQIATTKLSKATRKIDEITDDLKLSQEEKQERIQEIEETTREEIQFLFENPEYAVVQTRKEEKGTPDKIHLKYQNVRYPQSQASLIGRLEIWAQGELSVPDILREVHKRLKDIIHFEVELVSEDARGQEYHIAFNDLAALAKHQESELLQDDIVEGTYRDDDDDDDDDEYEEEDEEEEEGDYLL